MWWASFLAPFAGRHWKFCKQWWLLLPLLPLLLMLGTGSMGVSLLIKKAGHSFTWFKRIYTFFITNHKFNMQKCCYCRIFPLSWCLQICSCSVIWHSTFYNGMSVWRWKEYKIWILLPSCEFSSVDIFECLYKHIKSLGSVVNWWCSLNISIL